MCLVEYCYHVKDRKKMLKMYNELTLIHTLIFESLVVFSFSTLMSYTYSFYSVHVCFIGQKTERKEKGRSEQSAGDREKLRLKVFFPPS